MRRFIEFHNRYRVQLVLLGACVLAYGLFSTSLGFYWDGWPFAWISETYGNAGLVRYFSTNRPVWGWLYQLTTPLIGTNQVAWQIFGVITRWFSGVALWLLLSKLWPKHSEAAAWAALLFVLYPGFSQSSIANMYGHFYIVLTLALLSLWSHLQIVPSSDRVRNKNLNSKKGPVKSETGSLNPFSRSNLAFTLIALLLATYCIFATEYFFGLELLRPVLLFMALPPLSFQQRIKSVFSLWWPFGLLIIVYAYWRIFFLGFQTYDPFALATGTPPALTVSHLGTKMVTDALLTGLAAWYVPIPRLISLNWASSFSLPSVVLAILAAMGFYIGLPHRKHLATGFAWNAISLGISALLLSGLPVWAIGLPIRFGFPNDRLTLPMMFGASLVLTGLGYLLVRPPSFRRGLFALIAGISLAFQFLSGSDYRIDWKYQQSLFWQLVWRAPALEHGTILVLNELFKGMHVSDNSLVGPVNWLYSPNYGSNLDYYVAYAPLRLQEDSFLSSEPGRPINVDYLVANFEGSTDRMLVILFKPPGCLRILDPVYDDGYPQLPRGLDEMLPLSDPKGLIFMENSAEPSPAFGAEPSHDNWCYYLQKADLARQQLDWQTVADLGDIAFELDDSPNHATERLPFIEGYAMVGRWKEAQDLTLETLEINRFTSLMVCSLWQRVDANSQSPNREAIEAMLALSCQ